LQSKNLNSFISKITIGAILDIIKSDDSQTYLANLLIFFNMIGIFFLIVYSIRIRKMMLEMQIDLDQEKNTPSDYALLVRNIPLTMTQEELKIKFETMFNKFNVKV